MTVPVGDEDQDLLQFFYQCPVGLIETDDALRVRRINPAAVRLLAEIDDGAEFADLAPLLERIAPQAADAARARPAELGRLRPDRRFLSSSIAGPASSGLELQIVRHRHGRLMIVVLDVSLELDVTDRRLQRAVAVQQSLIDVGRPAPEAGDPGGVPKAHAVLDLIVGSATEHCDADVSALLLLDPGCGDLVLTAVDGPAVRADVLIRSIPASVLERFTAADPPGMSAGQVLLGVELAHVCAAPLAGPGGPRGLMVAGRRPGRPAFSDIERQGVDLAAGSAAVALELADAVAARDRAATAESHARLMHDDLIQNLFAAGLQLERLAHTLGVAGPGGQLAAPVETIDGIIRRLRETLTEPSPHGSGV